MTSSSKIMYRNMYTYMFFSHGYVLDAVSLVSPANPTSGIHVITKKPKAEQYFGESRVPPRRSKISSLESTLFEALASSCLRIGPLSQRPRAEHLAPTGEGGGRGGDGSDPHFDDDTGSHIGDNNNHTNTLLTTRTRTHVSDSFADDTAKSEEEDHPFYDEIMSYKMYRMPSNLTLLTTLKSYDGIGDPKVHVTKFKTAMLLNDASDPIL
ncbi:hypothetical protein PIB30_065384 [Stylosanthes scabra]|uniref:Uncharacterized protein n=1 Tax=Stylosanthes scabra TaxID=79078 RepID=A0ABU6SMB5_9FABA|nr:hypothetical protein [Stylosanthes scabra]